MRTTKLMATLFHVIVILAVGTRVASGVLPMHYIGAFGADVIMLIFLLLPFHWKADEEDADMTLMANTVTTLIFHAVLNLFPQLASPEWWEKMHVVTKYAGLFLFAMAVKIFGSLLWEVIAGKPVSQDDPRSSSYD